MCLVPFENTRLLTFKSSLKKLILFVEAFFYIQFKSETSLKSRILGLNFVQ